MSAIMLHKREVDRKAGFRSMYSVLNHLGYDSYDITTFIQSICTRPLNQVAKDFLQLKPHKEVGDVLRHEIKY